MKRIYLAILSLLISAFVLSVSCNKTATLEPLDFPTYVESNGVSLSVNENNSSPVSKPIATIDYAVPETGHIRLALYNITGYELAVLVDEVQGPGIYSVPFDNINGKQLGTGLYIIELEYQYGVQLKLTYILR